MARKRNKNIAVIDIGTNSFHLIFARPTLRGGSFRVVKREKEYIRLGSNISEKSGLSQEAMNRGIKALARFKDIADAAHATVRAVATSSVREAPNKKEFLRRADSEAGVSVEVISGVEEARFIYHGVLQSLSVFDKRILMIDIGGGSTELLIGSHGRVHYAESLKLGAIRLTERFFPEGKVDKKAIKECRKFIRTRISSAVSKLKKDRYETVIGSSGTILTITKVVKRLRSKQGTIALNNFSFTEDELSEVLRMLIKAETKRERSKIPGLRPARADIIVAGALILEQLFETLRIKSLTISSYALREGVLYDTLKK